MEATRSTETSVYNKPTWSRIPEYGTLRSHRSEILKSYNYLYTSLDNLTNLFHFGRICTSIMTVNNELSLSCCRKGSYFSGLFQRVLNKTAKPLSVFGFQTEYWKCGFSNNRPLYSVVILQTSLFWRSCWSNVRDHSCNGHKYKNLAGFRLH
jgi:hypothetical protein